MATLGPLADNRVREFLRLARIGRLATSDRGGVPHNIPLCFWFDEDAHFYFVIDEKPKRLTAKGLKRMRNIAENPQAALIIDHYEEQWNCLAYVLVHGEAHTVEDPSEYMLALRNLRDKYLQYRSMTLSFESNPMVRIDARHVHVWGDRFKAERKAAEP
ncbi:MAG: pyridoxamine 5'-phosphate oxidase family protein [Candidatus Binataceae bacterium]